MKGFEPSPVVHEENSPRRSAGRSSEKRKLKAQLKIHAQRGKKAR
ncbi:ATP-dependent RNA helicase [Vibrio cholerae]|nr:ATP-dependent RNA helicase [Vibrio cholerae]